MKTVICLMFACVLMASTAQAQAPAPAPAAQAGQKVPFSEGLRRSYNTIKMNLTETAQKFDEATYRLYAVSRDPRLRRAARACRQLAVQRLRGGQGRGESASGFEPREDEDDEGRHHPGARGFVRVLRCRVCEPDRSERSRARAPGPERSRPRLRAGQPDHARQRRVRHPDGLHAHKGHGPAVDRARHARTWRSAAKVRAKERRARAKKRRAKSA